MIWIDYVLLAFLAVMIFGVGFFCGYVKDKKEAFEWLREAKKYDEEAERHLNEAKGMLDKAHNFYEEVDVKLKMMAKMNGEEM